MNTSHSLLSSKGTILSHTSFTRNRDVHQNQQYWKQLEEKLQEKRHYSHNLKLADNRKSHSEETGKESRKQVPELFLRV